MKRWALCVYWVIPVGSGERSFLKAAVIFPRWVIVVPHRGGLMWKEMPRTTKLTNRNAALMSDILNGLCSLATPGMCYVRSRRKDGQICFIDKPEEWIMILRGKSASHTGNSSVDSTPFLLTDFCHCKTWGNGREMSFDLGSLWIVSFQNCCEMKWLQIVAVKCKQEIQMAGKKY